MGEGVVMGAGSAPNSVSSLFSRTPRGALHLCAGVCWSVLGYQRQSGQRFAVPRWPHQGTGQGPASNHSDVWRNADSTNGSQELRGPPDVRERGKMQVVIGAERASLVGRHCDREPEQGYHPLWWQVAIMGPGLVCTRKAIKGQNVKHNTCWTLCCSEAECVPKCPIECLIRQLGDKQTRSPERRGMEESLCPVRVSVYSDHPNSRSFLTESSSSYQHPAEVSSPTVLT